MTDDASVAEDLGRWAEHRLVEVEAQIARYKAEAAVLRQMINASNNLDRLRRGLPVESNVRASSEPVGTEAVALILHEAARPMAASEVAAVAVERGWITSNDPQRATRTNLQRAMKYGTVQRVHRGLYEFVAAGSEVGVLPDQQEPAGETLNPKENDR